MPDSTPKTVAREKASRAAMVLFGGTGVNFFVRLLRNVLIARFLTVEDFGIASTFVVAMSLVEMATNLGFGRMLIQHRAGDNPRFVHAVSSMILLRGIFISAVLLVSAGPIAHLMGQPEHAWAYRWMAVVPLLQSMIHPEINQRQRRMEFMPNMINKFGTMVLTLIAVWPLYLWLGDFRVMLAVYIIEATLRVVLSHLLARMPYRLGWSREVARDGLRFGWPLMLSGIVNFAVQQGDRIIVSNFYGNAALGLFSAAIVMTMAPMLQGATIINSFFLPMLSRVQNDQKTFDHYGVFVLQSTILMSLAGVLGYCLLGPTVLTLVFGEKYAGGGPYVALLGIAFSMQLVRAGAATIAMARAHTVNMLVTNMLRVAFLLPAVWLAMQGRDVVEVLMVGAIGQIAGVVIAIYLLHRRTGLGALRSLAPLYGLSLAALTCVLAGILTPPQGLLPQGWMAFLSCVLFLVCCAFSRTLWRETLRQARRRG